MATATIHYRPGFDEVQAAERLEKALRNKEKSKVIEILTSVSNAQRQMIRTPFKTRYGKDLEAELKKVLSGDLEDFLVALMQTPLKLDAVELHRAVKGLGTNERNLIEILTTRSNEDIFGVKNTFLTTYGKSLEDAVSSDTSGDFRKLLIICLQGKRGEQPTDIMQASRQIVKSLDKKSGVDKFEAFKVFATADRRDVLAITDDVERASGKEFSKIVEKELSGDFKNLVNALVETSRNSPRFLANMIHAATKGIGTRDKDLIRIIVSRCETDLKLIEHEYETIYGKSLVQLIKDECKGDYRDALLAVLKGNNRY